MEFGIGDEQIAAIEKESKEKVDAATEACKAAPPPSAEILTTDVYADGGWAWRN
jgi:pyruvate dehydrogenase E1 component alpha subunit